MISKMFSYILIFLIRLYQLFISPILGQNCRYLPTCSEYATQSLKKHGAMKGLILSFKRIFKCHPWGGQGYDPVPKKIGDK
tara:strand:- start:5992 stop:6234 length:243 start_codon:yes stop_codon:yes gene_type:complete